MNRGSPEVGAVARAAAFRAGRFEQVCRLAEQDPPESIDDRLVHARALLGLGRAAEALAVLRAAADRTPTTPEPALRYYLACALARLGRWLDAEAELGQLVDDPTWSSRARATRAQVRVRAGAWPDAAADYEALSAAGHLAPRDRLGWAACLAQLGRWPEAQALLETIITGTAPPELAWWLLGRCHESQGDWNAAAEVYRRGLERSPFSEALGTKLLAASRRPAARRADSLLRAVVGRQRLLDDWSRRQAERPSNLDLAHRIALLTSFWAAGLPPSTQEKARPIWRIALGNWAILLEDARWADAFIERRAKVYAQAVTTAERTQFETGLEGQVERFVAAAHGDQPQLAEPTVRDSFLRERHACRVLREVGGLGNDGAADFVLGPDQASRLGLLGHVTPCLQRVAKTSMETTVPDWLPWPDLESWHAPSRRLRLLFSTLGYAQVRLERADPEGVLGALRWAVCPTCLAAGGGAPDATTVAVCRSDCPELVRRNPGFADLPDPRGALRAAGGWLALQAHIAGLLRELDRPEPDAAAMGTRWRAARAGAATGPRGDALRAHLIRVTLDAARALSNAERGASAVSVLEEAVRCEPGEASLGAALAVALTDWAIDLANGGSHSAAVPLLRRALELAPEMHRARISLVRVLLVLASQASDAGDDSAASSAIGDAEALLDTPAPGPGLDELRGEFALAHAGMLGHRAAAAYARDDFTAAATLLDDALQQCDRVPKPETIAAERRRFQDYRKTVCLEAADAAARRGALAEARAWQTRAATEDPYDAGDPS